MQRRERSAAARLEIHRLPDAARLSVPLLPLELERVRAVVDADRDALRRTVARARRELDGERNVPALVLADLGTVEPDGGAPIGCADDQVDAPSAPALGDGDGTSIPADLRAVGHAGRRRAPRERHEDRPWRRKRSAAPAGALPLVALVEGEVPAAVQVRPLGTLEVGPGMLRERDRVAPHLLRVRGQCGGQQCSQRGSGGSREKHDDSSSGSRHPVSHSGRGVSTVDPGELRSSQVRARAPARVRLATTVRRCDRFTRAVIPSAVEGSALLNGVRLLEEESSTA